MTAIPPARDEPAPSPVREPIENPPREDPPTPQPPRGDPAPTKPPRRDPPPPSDDDEPDPSIDDPPAPGEPGKDDMLIT